jgi:hypothetical protein
MQNDGVMSGGRSLALSSVVSLACGWAAVTVGSHLVRGYPAAETPIRWLCAVLGGVAMGTIWALVVIYHRSQSMPGHGLPRSVRRGVILFGASILLCGAGAVFLDSYLARRYPGAEWPLRLLCYLLGAWSPNMISSLALLYSMSKKRRCP